MFDKFFVGGDVMSSVNNGKFKPISRVTLMLDDDNAITAGDDTGREIVANCPHATQDMVNALLASMKGHEYQAYEADSANIDPSAELGDGVTVGGIYSVIATIRDDGSGYASISAPGESELEDEYPMDGPITQMFNRKLAETRSVISKRVDELYLAVFGEEGSGAEASIKVQLDQITQEVKGAIGVDEETGKLLPVSSSINLALGDITAKVEGAIGVDQNGDLIPVSSSVELALGEAIISVSNGTESSTFTLKVGDAEIKSPEIKMTGVVTFDGLESGKTTINGSWLETKTVNTDALYLEGMLTVYDGDSNNPGGYIGFDDGFNSSSGIGMRRYSPDIYGNTQGPQIVCTDIAARMSFTTVAGQNTSDTSVVCKANSLSLTGYQLIQMLIDGNVLIDLDTDGFYPASSNLTLGTSTRMWDDIFAAGTSFSKLANSVSDLLTRVSALDGK